MKELVIDSFAGGGGASTGIEMALGRSPDFAINHDDVALAMHAVNHPATHHLPHNVWKVDPTAICGRDPVGLLWASPDCKHFSKAKGGRPVEKNIRDLAWVVVRWARQVSPRVIILENVEEFQTWGPLGDDGRPCPERKGQHFKRWVGELRKLGYKVEWRELCAADYGAPTVRKRLFLIARRDGLPIIWPKPTHGKPDMLPVRAGKLKPWRTAAEIIDWSLPCHSIFLTQEEGRAVGVRRPLAPATMARIAKGIQRYVINHADPFIVPLTHSGDTRTYDINEPARTLTTANRGEQALIAPTLINTRNGERLGQEPRCRDIQRPYPTVTAEGSQGAVVIPHLQTMRNSDKPFNEANKPTHTVTAGGAHLHLVSAFLAQHNTDMVGHDAREAVSTIVQKGCTQAVVSAGLVNLKGSDRRQSAPTAPAPTVTAGGTHVAEVRAFLLKYYGTDQDPRIDEPLHTCTTKPRFGLVMVNGEPHEIVDIGMRMLTPRELFRAQGFPESYIIDRTPEGYPITKTDQIHKCGNSVCPQVAAALVGANYQAIDVTETGVPAFALEAAE
jgi:DNA (cytosine-5)-methyltransferase 1